MIFITIGSLFTFDRLIRLMDELSPRWPNEEFFAQIGVGTYEPRNMPFARNLPSPVFAEKVRTAKLIVAHAGMGSVISALEAQRPIVILPRDMALAEHTTDHQTATARWLSGKPGIFVAMDESELPRTIDRALSSSDAGEQTPTSAPPEFLARIRDFIDQPLGRDRRP